MSTGPFSFEVFAALVEDTFDHPAGTVHRTTRCDDVSGWDSLGHSVLLARLSKRHRISITEADAARAETVGSLHDRMAELPRGEVA